MIKLNSRLPEERKKLLKKFRYSNQDLLNLDEINVYQFNRGSKSTQITKLESREYGFVVPTFNDALDKLFEEIYDFQGDES